MNIDKIIKDFGNPDYESLVEVKNFTHTKLYWFNVHLMLHISKKDFERATYTFYRLKLRKKWFGIFGQELLHTENGQLLSPDVQVKYELSQLDKIITGR